jgi:hypothetical protein
MQPDSPSSIGRRCSNWGRHYEEQYFTRKIYKDTIRFLEHKIPMRIANEKVRYRQVSINQASEQY